MRNNKGFTLIELLAVIIILAIIALITTPTVLNMINQAREGAAEDKAWGTIDAVKLAYTEAQLSATSAISSSDNEVTVTFGATGAVTSNPTGAITAIKTSGETPHGGTVTVKSDGTISCLKLYYESDGYYCSTLSADSSGKYKEDTNNMVCSKTSTDVEVGATAK